MRCFLQFTADDKQSPTDNNTVALRLHQVNFSCPIQPKSCRALFQEFRPYYILKFLHIKAPRRFIIISVSQVEKVVPLP